MAIFEPINFTEDLKLIPMDELSEKQWDNYLKHYAYMHTEEFPIYPIPNPQIRKNEILVKEPDYTALRWIIELNDKFVGYLFLGFESETSPSFENNKNFSSMYITLEPEFRNRGIGTYLLDYTKKLAVYHKKTQVSIWTPHAIAKLVCPKWDFELRHEHFVNKLDLVDVDWELMQQWREKGHLKAEGVTLEMFQDVPEKDIEEFVRVYESTENDSPWGGDSKEVYSVEKRRETERYQKEKGKEITVLIAREEDGTISGLTEIYYDSNDKEAVQQELTGVLKKYRGRSLGKWLKAEMLFYIRDKYPEAKYISTGNAMTNAPMLAINKAMGFQEAAIFHLYTLKL